MKAGDSGVSLEMYVEPEKEQSHQLVKQRKYGMKRRIYDDFPILQRDFPRNVYRTRLSENEMAGYSPIVKKALSLENGNISEIKKGRIFEIINIFGKHKLDTGSPAI